MKTRIEHFEQLLQSNSGWPAEKRFTWLQGFREGLLVSGCLQSDLVDKVCAALEQVLDELAE